MIDRSLEVRKAVLIPWKVARATTALALEISRAGKWEVAMNSGTSHGDSRTQT
jgi:hypothetical protein